MDVCRLQQNVPRASAATSLVHHDAEQHARSGVARHKHQTASHSGVHRIRGQAPLLLQVSEHVYAHAERTHPSLAVLIGLSIEFASLIVRAPSRVAVLGLESLQGGATAPVFRAVVKRAETRVRMRSQRPCIQAHNK